jgi:hypothetical protein
MMLVKEVWRDSTKNALGINESHIPYIAFAVNQNDIKI